MPALFESLTMDNHPLEDLKTYNSKTEAGLNLLKEIRKKICNWIVRPLKHLVEIACLCAQDLSFAKTWLSCVLYVCSVLGFYHKNWVCVTFLDCATSRILVFLPSFQLGWLHFNTIDQILSENNRQQSRTSFCLQSRPTILHLWKKCQDTSFCRRIFSKLSEDCVFSVEQHQPRLQTQKDLRMITSTTAVMWIFFSLAQEIHCSTN